MTGQKDKKYQQTEQYKKSVVAGQKKWRDEIYGSEIEHIKSCIKCGTEFKWFGRERTRGFEYAKYCSTKCSKSRSEYWDANATQYQTIAFKHHKRECVVCGFDKIVTVHHFDEDHYNNDPKNLVPLCPNHHQMMHSRYRNEIVGIVEEYLSLG